jgi:hypothetical protein
MPELKGYLFLLFGMFLSLLTVFGQNNDSPWYPIGEKSTKNNTDNDKYASASLGFGTSYGGYGAKINYLLSTEKRIGLQFGVGYYFEDIMYRGAIKFYLWKKLYCDLKYGMFSRKFDLQYDEKYDVDEVARIVTGPGLMLGYEIDIIKNIGFNAGGGFNYDTKYKQGISYSYDIGLLYRF